MQQKLQQALCTCGQAAIRRLAIVVSCMMALLAIPTEVTAQTPWSLWDTNDGDHLMTRVSDYVWTITLEDYPGGGIKFRQGTTFEYGYGALDKGIYINGNGSQDMERGYSSYNFCVPQAEAITLTIDVDMGILTVSDVRGLTPVPEYDEIYLRGDCNGWHMDDSYRFSTEDGRHYTLSIPVLGGNFKIGDRYWSVVDYGGYSPDVTVGNLVECCYGPLSTDFTVDPLTEVTIEFDLDAAAMVIYGTPMETESLYIVGDIFETGWNPGKGTKMAWYGPGLYTWTGEVKGGYYFCFSHYLVDDWSVFNSGRFGPGTFDLLAEYGTNQAYYQSDTSWKMPTDAVNVKMDFDTNTRILTLKNLDEPEETELYFRGDVNKWVALPEYRLGTDDYVIYSLAMKGSVEGGFKIGGPMWEPNYGAFELNTLVEPDSIYSADNSDSSYDWVLARAVENPVIRLNVSDLTLEIEERLSASWMAIPAPDTTVEKLEPIKMVFDQNLKNSLTHGSITATLDNVSIECRLIEVTLEGQLTFEVVSGSTQSVDSGKLRLSVPEGYVTMANGLPSPPVEYSLYVIPSMIPEDFQASSVSPNPGILSEAKGENLEEITIVYDCPSLELVDPVTSLNIVDGDGEVYTSSLVFVTYEEQQSILHVRPTPDMVLTAGEYSLEIPAHILKRQNHVLFDFVTNDYGLERQAGTSQEYITEGTVIKNEDVRIRFGTSQDGMISQTCRLWADGLRFYRYGAMEIFASGSLTDVELNYSGSQWLQMEGNGVKATTSGDQMKWTGNADLISITPTEEFTRNNVAIKDISVTYGLDFYNAAETFTWTYVQENRTPVITVTPAPGTYQQMPSTFTFTFEGPESIKKNILGGNPVLLISPDGTMQQLPATWDTHSFTASLPSASTFPLEQAGEYTVRIRQNSFKYDWADGTTSNAEETDFIYTVEPEVIEPQDVIIIVTPEPGTYQQMPSTFTFTFEGPVSIKKNIMVANPVMLISPDGTMQQCTATWGDNSFTASLPATSTFPLDQVGEYIVRLRNNGVNYVWADGTTSKSKETDFIYTVEPGVIVITLPAPQFVANPREGEVLIRPDDGVEAIIDCTIQYESGVSAHMTGADIVLPTDGDNPIVEIEAYAVAQSEAYADSPIARYTPEYTTVATVSYHGKTLSTSGHIVVEEFADDIAKGVVLSEGYGIESAEVIPTIFTLGYRTLSDTAFPSRKSVFANDAFLDLDNEEVGGRTAGDVASILNAQNGQSMDGVKVYGTVGEVDLGLIAQSALTKDLRHLDLSSANTGTRMADGVLAGMEMLTDVHLPKTLTSPCTPFGANPRLVGLIWTAENPIPQGIVESAGNPNLLLYRLAITSSYGDIPCNEILMTTPTTEGVCGNLVLHAGYPFGVTMDFVADHVEYTREFSQETAVNSSAGWESIALPFSPTSVRVSGRNVALVPFASYSGVLGQIPYWLKEVNPEGGWKDARAIEAGVPYIIAMPNNAQYPSDWRVSGEVTFATSSRTRLSAASSSPVAVSWNDGRDFVPVWGPLEEPIDGMALNVGISDIYDADLQCTLNPGEAFVREVDPRPFEAYVTRHGGEYMYRIGQDVSEVPEIDSYGITVTSDGNAITVVSGEDCRVALLRVDGVTVCTIYLTAGESKTVRNLDKGVYLIAGKKLILK